MKRNMILVLPVNQMHFCHTCGGCGSERSRSGDGGKAPNLDKAGEEHSRFSPGYMSSQMLGLVESQGWLVDLILFSCSLFPCNCTPFFVKLLYYIINSSVFSKAPTTTCPHIQVLGPLVQYQEEVVLFYPNISSFTRQKTLPV